jgi:hypothetical protein
MFRSIVLLVVVANWFGNVSAARADEPGRVNVVIARGVLREQIHSLPIVERPYRPFHFYGNAVRWAYYHGRGGASPVAAAVSATPASAPANR